VKVLVKDGAQRERERGGGVLYLLFSRLETPLRARSRILNSAILLLYAVCGVEGQETYKAGPVLPFGYNLSPRLLRDRKVILSQAAPARLCAMSCGLLLICMQYFSPGWGLARVLLLVPFERLREGNVVRLEVREVHRVRL
jgi:hypothetical protein